jgi:hypothetical protein
MEIITSLIFEVSFKISERSLLYAELCSFRDRLLACAGVKRCLYMILWAFNKLQILRKPLDECNVPVSNVLPNEFRCTCIFLML